MDTPTPSPSPEYDPNFDKRRIPKTGRKHTPEALEKMSKAKIGKPLSEAHKAAIGDANRGKIISAETREKL
jgi:hypothetical protein